MWLTINKNSLEIHDARTLIQLIDDLSEVEKEELVSELLSHSDLIDIISEGESLRDFLNSSISSHASARIIAHALADRGLFERLIPTSPDLQDTLLCLDESSAHALFQHILDNQNVFDNFFKNRSDFINFLIFLEDEYSIYPEYKKSLIDKVINMSRSRFAELVGTKRELIQFARKNLEFCNKLVEKGIKDCNSIQEIIELVKIIEKDKLLSETRKKDLLLPVPGQLQERLLNKNERMSFIEFYKASSAIFSKETLNKITKDLLVSDSEILKLRVNNLFELIELLQILPEELAKKLFSRVLEEQELFNQIIIDNQNLSDLLFIVSMHDGRYSNTELEWARGYWCSSDAICTYGDYAFELKPEIDRGEKYPLLNHSVELLIQHILSAELNDFIWDITHKNQAGLTNRITQANSNSFLCERLFKSDKVRSRFPELLALIPVPIALNLVYQISQNQGLALFFDDMLHLPFPYHFIYSFKRAIDKVDLIALDKLREELIKQVKTHAIKPLFVNFILDIAVIEKAKVTEKPALKEHLDGLIRVIQDNRIPSLKYLTTCFFKQANEGAGKSDINKQLTSDSVKETVFMSFLDTDPNNNNCRLKLSQDELNKKVMSRLLEQAKSNPAAIASIFANTEFAAQFDAQELYQLALSNEKIAKIILSQQRLVMKLERDDIMAIINAYPEILVKNPDLAIIIVNHPAINLPWLETLMNAHPNSVVALVRGVVSNPNKFFEFVTTNGYGTTLVALAKYNDQAASLILGCDLNKWLTADNLTEIYTSQPGIISSLLDNEFLMNKIYESDATELLAVCLSMQTASCRP
ncbi:hypothetical protein OQJ15_06260 [Fluoribacter dumoffii]|uniref:Uncharacterized protein n=1 Tax=Fluoribacter dumoffii TaxID=463 RepID=A0A377GA64_9GAMM|nr:hypothetical protein [Fluoribacter dumoffii]KTC88797.1 hypothetical protein Ldum_3055 [Fluoribacter dumoffii NY 23]MCW8385907.1 hypothetical protein [Fluoribacter dumoffii]MCW8495798.1 hypothetical protein [Fluoribacter dumoffii]STO21715.1 Uncharacterised protein [Fluoribacter dumoffii]